MYPYSQLPQPLPVQVFYTLLALSRAELHAYAIKGAILNDSLGGVDISAGRLYPLIARLHDEGLIDMVGSKPAGKSGQERQHYGISKHGIIRLKEEFMRLGHALKIGEAAGLLENEPPPEIQRLTLNL